MTSGTVTEIEPNTPEHKSSVITASACSVGRCVVSLVGYLTVLLVSRVYNVRTPCILVDKEYAASIFTEMHAAGFSETSVNTRLYGITSVTTVIYIAGRWFMYRR
jgi:hypothetical protein